MVNEKQKAAFGSVVAAVFLTVLKIVVGVFTGSLGIVSEAIHSAMDLFAAGITMFAVRFAEKPADVEHHYGHGKMESLSALIEVLILWATCIWVIYEAIEKMFFGQSLEVTGSFWGIAVLVISIVVNVSRAKILKKVAVKYGSQALEADALHFASDVWSSLVVIAGLIGVWCGQVFHIGWLKYADPIAALGVAALVLQVSVGLARQTLNVLLDTAPKGMKEEIQAEVGAVRGVIETGDIRVRPSGAENFIEVAIGIDVNESQEAEQQIVDEIKSRIRSKITRSNVFVSTYPVLLESEPDRALYRTVKSIVNQYPECVNIHNLHVYEYGGKKRIAAHVELKENMTLKQSHSLSHEIEKKIDAALADISGVSIIFEYADQRASADSVSEDELEETRGRIKTLISGIDRNLDCHEIELYSNGGSLSAFLHCGSAEDYSVDRLKSLSTSIKAELKRNVEHLDSVHIHFEPAEEEEPRT